MAGATSIKSESICLGDGSSPLAIIFFSMTTSSHWRLWNQAWKTSQLDSLQAMNLARERRLKMECMGGLSWKRRREEQIKARKVWSYVENYFTNRSDDPICR